jgi:hypothetical protein
MSSALSWTNIVPASAISTFPAVGSFTVAPAADPSYPLSNAADTDPSKVARVTFTSAAGSNSLAVRATVAADATVRVVAALNVRLPAGCTAAFQAFNLAGVSQETTTTIVAANLVPIPGTTDRYDIFGLFAANRSVNRPQLNIGVPASTAGYVEVGHLWAGPSLVFSEGTDKGWSLGGVDPSEVTRTRGGMLLSTRMPTRKKLSISFAGREYNPMMGTPGTASALSMRQFMLEAGVSSPVLAVHRSTDVHAIQVNSLYGSVTRMPQIDDAGGNKFGSKLEIEQIR